MSQSPANPSRRQALKIFGGVPLFPLSVGAGGSALLAACGGSGTTAAVAATPTAAAFTAMAAPTLADATAMAGTTVASSLQVSYSDGSKQAFKLGYQELFQTGTQVPKLGGGTTLAGGYYDINDQPINDVSVPGQTRQFFSDCPDGMSLLQPIAGADKAKLGVKGNPLFAVVQFEYASRDLAGLGKSYGWGDLASADNMYGKLPSPIAVLTLDQDPATGKLSLVSYFDVPTKPAYGLWIACGASLTPWNTHLGSEEYEPDALAVSQGKDSRFNAFINYLYNDPNAYTDLAKANPYLYGHMPEVIVNPDGTGKVVKHFCMGRHSQEVAQIMPDQRTALMGDDWTNGGPFLFIADKAADLSAGTLYAPKMTQTTPAGEGTGSFTVKWIKLGHATSAEIEQLAKTLKISDIMDVATVDPQDTTYTKIRYSGKDNWVRVKAGMELAAAFLETHRYSALKGASMSFTKLEGVTADFKNKVAYVAMSSITSAMTDGTTDVKVKPTKAGAVYALNLKAAQTDTEGNPIGSDWVPVDMAAPSALIGEDLATPDALGNLANPDKIANPDNLKFSAKLGTLFIGEDSGMHVNNFLWAYQPANQQLSRLMSTPPGAESTGLQDVDDVNGWTYVMSNFQHCADWESALHGKVRSTLEPLVDKLYQNGFGASVGYITGLPQTTKV